MIKAVLITAAALSMNASMAATLSAGSIACTSEDKLTQLATAVNTGDKRAIEWLVKRGCIITRKDFPATALSVGESGAHEVRVYGDNGVTANMWTAEERIGE